MKTFLRACVATLAAGALSMPAVAQPNTVRFGDDSSTWANDGECDDPRFEGEGMATTLLEEDRLRDATDCRALYQNGSIRLRDQSSVRFGDNSSAWANDGECDDPRFIGSGMATTLLDEDTMRDANDCRALYNAGQIRLRNSSSDIDFGDDSSQWANDGECDDPRFRGPGMTNTPLLDSDIRADATDCRTAYERGELTFVG